MSNYELNKTGAPQYLGTDLLLNYIVNNMDIKLSDYYRWLDDTKNILPASNSIVSIDASGNLYDTENLSSSMEEMYNLREKMQYKFLLQ